MQHRLLFCLHNHARPMTIRDIEKTLPWQMTSVLHELKQHTLQLEELLQKNTQITDINQQNSKRIEMMTVDLQGKIVRKEHSHRE
jgi:Na+-transporting NADH:ubiquinone oxidoreductase subunit NqrC